MIGMSSLLAFLAFVSFSSAWNKHMENPGLLEGDVKVSMKQLLFGSITNQRWENDVVPYVIDTSLEYQTKAIIGAIGVYHRRTCLQFINRTIERDYIKFFKGSGCWSYVGRIGGAQSISLGDGCHSSATIEHEIGHAIGLDHEQNRPDRDQYVTVHFQNLNDKKFSNNYKINSNINSLGTVYDLYSMMHYGSTGFAKAGTKTITTKDPTKQHIIDNNYHYGMSDTDAKQINLMYKCTSVVDPNGKDVKNLGGDCFYNCGKTGGACPYFCGKDGVCCRQGWADTGCDRAETPCKFHCCTGMKEVKNKGQDCWHWCYNKGGSCPSFCGKDGVCCRQGWADAGCERAESPCKFHCCTGSK